MRLLKLFQVEVQDGYARENFSRLQKYAQESVFDKGNFKFFEFAMTSATYPATLEMVHHLGFQPKDVLTLNVTPDTATVTWNYDSFTSSFVSVTISAALTVRAFIGRYGEN